MKKIIASFPLLVLLLISCDKKDENATFQNDLKTYNLNGNVKSVQEKSYEFVGGDAKGNLKRENTATFDTEIEFDSNHQLISEKSFLSDGKLVNSKTFEFKNRMLTEEEFLPNDVIYKTKYTFDGDKNTIVSKRDKAGKQIHRTVNTFEKGLLTQKRVFDVNDQLSERFTYKYDKQGNAVQVAKLNEYETFYTDVFAYDNKKNKVSEARLDKNGKMSYKILMTYKDSLITNIVTLDSEGKEQSTEKRAYDSKGKILNKSFEDKLNNEFIKESFSYDKSGNLTEWILYNAETKAQSISYKFDEHNNLTQMERRDATGTVQENKKYAYEYDEQGNWIKKSIINNDLQTFVLERKIQYY